MNITEPSGFEHLTSDTELYNLLISAKKSGDPYLKNYNIKYIDQLFSKNPPTQEENNLYIVRVDSQLLERAEDANIFTATVHIILSIRKYDTITAQKILKSTYKRIMFHIANNNLISVCKVKQVRFEYEQPGILNRAAIELEFIELEDFDFKVEALNNLEFNMGIETDVGDVEWKGEFK